MYNLYHMIASKPKCAFWQLFKHVWLCLFVTASLALGWWLASAQPLSTAWASADDADPAAATTIDIIMYIDAPFYFVNEVLQQMDTAPYLHTDAAGGGYTMVPVRFVAEALGASVDWDAATRSVQMQLGEQQFMLVVDQTIPGADIAATIREGRTFVPLRYVMETFGATVQWTQRERRIDIHYEGSN